MEFYRRIAQFSIFIGIVFLFLYWASTESGEATLTQTFYFVFCGGIAVLFGALLYWRFRPPPADAERFRTFRKLLRTDQDKKDHIKRSE